MESITLEKLAKLLGGTPLGPFDLKLLNLQDSKVCDEHSICYLKDQKFIDTLSNKAGAVITTQELADQINNKNLIVSSNSLYLNQLFIGNHFPCWIMRTI